MLGAWNNWRDPWFDDIASVLTIHNLGYQGVYGREEFPSLGLPDDVWTGGAIEHDGNVNLLKGAIVAADMITAVSPTYANEIRTPEGGVGLDGDLRARGERVVRRIPDRRVDSVQDAHDPFPARPQIAIEAHATFGCTDLVRVRRRDGGDHVRGDDCTLEEVHVAVVLDRAARPHVAGEAEA